MLRALSIAVQAGLPPKGFGQSLRPLLLLVSLALPCLASAGDFSLHDGDTVAFLGDSITAARGYTKIVEHYTLMRFPERKIQFVNAGVGGDTAAKALVRLEHDVFARHATVVIIALGINDIAWGMKANDESKQAYLANLRSIIEQCRAHQVRVILCSPAITAEWPERAEQGFLQKMADEALAMAQAMGVETIDLQRGMRAVQQRIVAANAKEPEVKKQTRLHVEDGVHLNDLGHLAMAFALLKGLGAPTEVSAATVDAETASVVEERGCHLIDVRKTEEGLTLVREDEGLPITFGGFSIFNFRWVPVLEQLDQYHLIVSHLPPGEYEIFAEGRSLGKAPAGQLAKGVNLAYMTGTPLQPGGPWDVQSQTVKELVDARDRLEVATEIATRNLRSSPASARAQADLEEENASLLRLQRQMAKPFPYHFAIKRVVTDGK